MNFSLKLKTLRKQFKLSQEQLAEKINVSRQAITKWETESGLPDIENLLAIAALFSVTLDELLSDEKLSRVPSRFTYESVTEYDVSRLSRFDIRAPGAMEVTVTESDNEKLRIRLGSNVLQTLSQDYKIKLDEHRDRLDVDIRRTGKSSEAEGKGGLFIHISLPARYCQEAELSAAINTLRLSGLSFPFELDGKVQTVDLESVSGAVVLNCNTDMTIRADGLPATINVNQINAASVLHIPEDARFYTKIKGSSNRINHAADGKPAGAPGDADAGNRIELAGMNAELLINRGGGAK